MKIGVLALQGDFREHRISLEKLGADVKEVRLPEHLEGLQGLIIPGGESTTIGKLMVPYGLLEPIRDFGQTRAVWGTCAGAILLAKEVGRINPARSDGHGNRAKCLRTPERFIRDRDRGTLPAVP